MARYKPKTTVGKQVANLAEIAKDDDGTGWGVKLPGGWLPTLSVDQGAISEAPTVKLRREAGDTYDAVLRHVDKVTEFGRLADEPTQAVVAAALAGWARELLAT